MASTHSSNLSAKVDTVFSERTRNPSLHHRSERRLLRVAAPNRRRSAARDRLILYEVSRLLGSEQGPTWKRVGAHPHRRQPRTPVRLAGIRHNLAGALGGFSVLPRSSPPRSRWRKARGILHARPFSNAPRNLFFRCYFPCRSTTRTLLPDICFRN